MNANREKWRETARFLAERTQSPETRLEKHGSAVFFTVLLGLAITALWTVFSLVN